MELRLLCVCVCARYSLNVDVVHLDSVIITGVYCVAIGSKAHTKLCQKHAHTSKRILAENDTPNNIDTSLNTLMWMCWIYIQLWPMDRHVMEHFEVIFIYLNN